MRSTGGHAVTTDCKLGLRDGLVHTEQLGIGNRHVYSFKFLIPGCCFPPNVKIKISGDGPKILNTILKNIWDY